MKILIDTDEFVEFFGEGWGSCDISTKEELKQFLVDFCQQKIEGEEEMPKEEEEQPTKNETCLGFDSITYFTRDQAQKHLELLQNTTVVMGKVSIRDYYRWAEFLQILPKWIAIYFKEDYGWTDLSTARVRSVHSRGIDLWTIEMPEPKRLTEN